jgi:hypothetical protein
MESKSVYFEVIMILGNNESIAYASSSIKSGESKQIILDASNFNAENNAEYLKISIRPLNDVDESVSMWFNGLHGHSVQYTYEELFENIKNYRLSADAAAEVSNVSKDIRSNIFTAIGISIAVISIGIGFLCEICTKRQKNVDKMIFMRYYIMDNAA